MGEKLAVEDVGVDEKMDMSLSKSHGIDGVER